MQIYQTILNPKNMEGDNHKKDIITAPVTPVEPPLNKMANLAEEKARHSTAIAVQNAVTTEQNPIAQLAHLRNLFSPSERVEKVMSRAMDRLCDILEEDEEVVALWTRAMGSAEWIDGRRQDEFTHVTLDEITLQILTGGRPNLEVWVRTAREHLNQLLTSPGSTFAHLGNPTDVQQLIEEAKRRNSHVPLNELARHLRVVIHTKLFYNATNEILQERLKRLMAKYGISSPESIHPDHRNSTPYFAYITLEQLKAYLNGDRSDYVFGIEESDQKMRERSMVTTNSQ